jgi:branched-chain amino acid transport system substrate-binding protein
MVGLVELSGGGATSGTNFDEGAKLALEEINAAGGILGRQIAYTSGDTQSQPQIAKALAQQAVDQDAYVVLGPVFSGSILVSMAETKRAEIPNFTGGEAAAITQQGNPYIFRTSFTQTTAMPKVARYLANDVKAKTVAMIWVNNDFGKGGLDAIKAELGRRNIRVAAEVSTEQNQVDFSSAVLLIAITLERKKFNKSARKRNAREKPLFTVVAGWPMTIAMRSALRPKGDKPSCD